jgi:hypothetical protein
MKQFNKLIESRQAIYDRGLTLAKDAQFELLDALLLGPAIRPFGNTSAVPPRLSTRKAWARPPHAER